MIISESSEGLHAVVEGEAEILRHLGRLITRDQRRKRDDAAVARAEARALPQIAKQRVLPILLERRRDRAHLVTRLGVRLRNG